MRIRARDVLEEKILQGFLYGVHRHFKYQDSDYKCSEEGLCQAGDDFVMHIMAAVDEVFNVTNCEELITKESDDSFL